MSGGPSDRKNQGRFIDPGDGLHGGGSTEVLTGSASRTVSRDVLLLDHVFDALAHPRRRYVCYAVLGDGRWSLRDLAAEVATLERADPDVEVSVAERNRVYVSLYHTHVPKLLEDGVLESDDADGTVAAGTHLELVAAALEGVGARLEDDQSPRARRTAGGRRD
jgi:hypothetical protein